MNDIISYVGHQMNLHNCIRMTGESQYKANIAWISLSILFSAEPGALSVVAEWEW